MALEILQRVCPREASLVNDRCICVKVRLRYVHVKCLWLVCVEFSIVKYAAIFMVITPGSLCHYCHCGML